MGNTTLLDRTYGQGNYGTGTFSENTTNVLSSKGISSKIPITIPVVAQVYNFGSKLNRFVYRVSDPSVSQKQELQNENVSVSSLILKTELGIFQEVFADSLFTTYSESNSNIKQDHSLSSEKISSTYLIKPPKVSQDNVFDPEKVKTTYSESEANLGIVFNFQANRIYSEYTESKSNIIQNQNLSGGNCTFESNSKEVIVRQIQGFENTTIKKIPRIENSSIRLIIHLNTDSIRRSYLATIPYFNQTQNLFSPTLVNRSKSENVLIRQIHDIFNKHLNSDSIIKVSLIRQIQKFSTKEISVDTRIRVPLIRQIQKLNTADIGSKSILEIPLIRLIHDLKTTDRIFNTYRIRRRPVIRQNHYMYPNNYIGIYANRPPKLVEFDLFYETVLEENSIFPISKLIFNPRFSTEKVLQAVSPVFSTDKYYFNATFRKADKEKNFE